MPLKYYEIGSCTTARRHSSQYISIFQLGVLKVDNHWLKVMAVIGCHTQTITFYYPCVFLMRRDVSLNGIPVPHFHAGCTVSARNHLQVAEAVRAIKSWQRLTEGEEWVTVRMRAVMSCTAPLQSLEPQPQSPRCRCWGGHTAAEQSEQTASHTEEESHIN